MAVHRSSGHSIVQTLYFTLHYCTKGDSGNFYHKAQLPFVVHMVLFYFWP